MSDPRSTRRNHDSFAGQDASLALHNFSHSPGREAAPRPRIRRRRRRPSKPLVGVVAGATVLVGSVSVYSVGGPWSPEAAVRLHAGALFIQDYEAAFDLLCSRDQAAYGSAWGYTVWNTDEATRSPLVVDGEATWDDTEDAWLVPVRRGTTPERRSEYVVVEEDGDFRVCGRPRAR